MANVPALKFSEEPTAALGALAKSQKAIIKSSPCLSVRMSFRMEQLKSQWKDFHEN
jgi:hypothetical protein